MKVAALLKKRERSTISALSFYKNEIKSENGKITKKKNAKQSTVIGNDNKTLKNKIKQIANGTKAQVLTNKDIVKNGKPAKESQNGNVNISSKEKTVDKIPLLNGNADGKVKKRKKGRKNRNGIKTEVEDKCEGTSSAEIKEKVASIFQQPSCKKISQPSTSKKHSTKKNICVVGSDDKVLEGEELILPSKASPEFLKTVIKAWDCDDSRKTGKQIMSYIVAPYSISEFFNKYWEKKHLHIKRSNSNYFKGIFSTEIFDRILREKYVEFTKNLDVTSYTDGVRETHNPSGRVYPSVVWDYFNNGCSVRFLNPQTFHIPVWELLAGMQDFMGSFCGANIYLTPGDSQGFAPHWDDIEAFVLQLEGKKRWRVYNPRNEFEVLPRYSSINLSQEEIGQPIIDVILEEGDLLYFPRGFIHQAEAVDGSHSLHITISTYQKNAYVDLIEKILSPGSLQLAASKNVELRKGLPRTCFDFMGKLAKEKGKKAGNAEKKTKNLELRKAFKENLSHLIIKTVLSDDTIDAAVDEMARQYLRVFLPPALSYEELMCTVQQDGERFTKNGIEGRVEIDPETRIRFLRAMTCRVAKEAGDSPNEYRLYHNVCNSREYEGRQEQYMIIEEKYLDALNVLIQSYPKYTAVENLPLPTLEDKITLAMALWEQCLIRTENPLNPIDDDGCELTFVSEEDSESDKE